MHYTTHQFDDSRIHVLEIPMDSYKFVPYLAAKEFPFRDQHPAIRAVDDGAVAVCDGGFNIVLYHEMGISDQPQHLLVKDREIWTTGMGSGGYGFCMGTSVDGGQAPGFVHCQKNKVQVRVWRSNGDGLEIEHVNFGHKGGRVIAYTARGGQNEKPNPAKHHVVLVPDSDWTEDARGQKRKMVCVSDWYTEATFATTPGAVVLEAVWPMKIQVEDIVTWVQKIGPVGTTDVLSGYPQMLVDGANVVKYLNMDPAAPHGPDNWFVRKNPRSGLGCSIDGKTAYIVFVEGRLPNQYKPKGRPSEGLRLKKFGRFCQEQGIANIINMDGGGSAFMWRMTKDGPVMLGGCYNPNDTLEGQRGAHFCPAVFER